MKILLRCLFIGISFGLIYGTYHKSVVDLRVGEKIIGFTVVFAAFVFLPIFLYHRWKGKRLKDYTLSEENLKKIRKNIENQVVSKNKPR
ncbi:MAG: hypothetical protein ISP72_04635 [Flavobacteriaceae bacterium]|nr:hypothetical protein [Flavobacteriaceae bacterium]|tara:strand:+ start:1568 stop:1834 length:267 start_codon:yes stop_codon:yes gene_type:complete